MAWGALLGIAAAMAALHIATNGAYGFHRDELQVLDDARRLARGYVAYPPSTPAVERVSMALFGVSLRGRRLAAVLAQAGVVLLAAMFYHAPHVLRHAPARRRHGPPGGAGSRAGSSSASTASALAP